MFNVPIDKIIPVTNARAQIASLVRDVQKTKSLYVLTRGGKPAAVLASIDYIHNNSLAKNSDVDKKTSELAAPKEVETEPILANDAKSDASIDTYNVQSNAAQKYDQEQPVRISIK